MKRKEEFKVELFFSLGKTNSYGVKIGCTEKRSFKLLKKKNDENGPFLILEAMIEDCVFILINLYNINTKNKLVSTWQKMNLMPQTFGDLENKIIIFGYNFNLFLEPVLGTEGGSPVLKKSSIWKLIEIKEKYNLCEIWRVRNTKENRFPTRQKRRSGFLQKRLDSFVVSNTLQGSIKDTEILPALSSDHSPL